MQRSSLFALLLVTLILAGFICGAEEVHAISHPLIEDTDGDGMPDGWEIEYGLDPSDPQDAGYDYNDDGLTNLEEYEKDEDPLERDVDGDDIDNLAERMGYLGFVTDPFEEDTDDDGLTDLEEIVMYVDRFNESQLRWVYKPIGVDNEKKQKIKEMQDEEQHWVYISRHDFSNLSLTWILDPTNPDSDGDGLEDGEEVDEYEFDPNIDDRTVDLDADGLDNVREVVGFNVTEDLTITTDPRDWDSDNDGLSDGEEVYGKYGSITNPTDADTDGDGVWDIEELLGFGPIDPSEHVVTYERFLQGNIYAGEYLNESEYITTMAKVNTIRTHSGTDTYRIDLRPPESLPGDFPEMSYAAVEVGNNWHYDADHGMIFTDDTFGFTLHEDDTIIICGKAGRFSGSRRTIHVNSEDSSGNILLVLDPMEKKYRWLPSESNIKMRKKLNTGVVSLERTLTPTPTEIPTPDPDPTKTPEVEPTPETPVPTPASYEYMTFFEESVYRIKAVIDYLRPWRDMDLS